jgi:hypothetical protein
MVGVDARHQIGIEQLVFETDYPHQDSTWPDTPALVAEIGARVGPGELEMLVRTNAIAMLDLDPSDLAPADLAPAADLTRADLTPADLTRQGALS